jgi:gas vesicle protein
MTHEKSTQSTLGNNLSYFLIGGGIGAFLALLFAPKTGLELRSDIADVTRKGLDKTSEMANQIGETAQTVYSDTRAKAEGIYDSAKEKINSATAAMAEIPGELQTAFNEKSDQISHSIEAGKKAFDAERKSMSKAS